MIDVHFTSIQHETQTGNVWKGMIIFGVNSIVFSKDMNVKSLLVFFLICIVAFSGEAWAQEEQPKTLVGDGHVKISGFGGPIIEFSSIGGTMVVGAGGGGAALFNNTFYFGGYGIGLSKSNLMNNSNIIDVEIGHGGFWTGFIIHPNSMIHGVISTKLGWGEISEFRRGIPISITDNIFVAQPQAEIELNITLWFKFSAGLGYRWVNGQDFSTVDLNGITGSVNFIFGWFGRR